MTSAVVLVVEDEPLLLMSAMDMIEDAGFEALGAANSAAAVKLLEERPDIALVFTDVDMPAGKDGIWLAMQIKDRWPPVHVIVTSGHRHVTEESLPTGAAFFRKPYSEDQILAEVRRVLH